MAIVAHQVFLLNLLEQDKINEGGKNPREPDAVIELLTLSTEDILKSSLLQAYLHFKNGGIEEYGEWTAQINLDNADPTSKIQNCATVVWLLLVKGGINKLQPKNSGPTSSELRKTYNCDAGQIAKGKFDAAFWRNWVVSPVLILHRVASAKENELGESQHQEKSDLCLSM